MMGMVLAFGVLEPTSLSWAEVPKSSEAPAQRQLGHTEHIAVAGVNDNEHGAAVGRQDDDVIDDIAVALAKIGPDDSSSLLILRDFNRFENINLSQAR